MERLVELRRLDGLPGLAIQWGATGDTGMVADLTTSIGDKELTIAGTVPQRVPSVFAAVDRFLSANGKNTAIYSCFVRAETAESVSDETKSGTDALLAIAKIIGVSDLNQVDPDKPFTEMGIDSLMAMEIRQVLESRCDITLPLKDLRTVNFFSFVLPFSLNFFDCFLFSSKAH